MWLVLDRIALLNCLDISLTVPIQELVRRLEHDLRPTIRANIPLTGRLRVLHPHSPGIPGQGKRRAPQRQNDTMRFER